MGSVQKIIVKHTEAALKKMKPGKATDSDDLAVLEIEILVPK